MEKIEVVLFIVMNEDGEYIVTHDEENMHETFENECGSTIREVTKITVMKSAPTIRELGPVDLPDTGTEFSLTVDSK